MVVESSQTARQPAPWSTQYNHTRVRELNERPETTTAKKLYGRRGVDGGPSQEGPLKDEAQARD